MHSASKPSLRKEKLEARLAIPKEQHSIFSAQIVKRLESAVNLGSGIVAIYHPVRGEVDVLSLMHRKNICLPVVVQGAKQLLFHKVEADHMLEKNHHGVMQPPHGAQVCLPDIVVTPLIAFDRRRFRIGYGAGYYDTTLAVLRTQKKIVAVGVAFALQEVAHVPEEPYDAHLDMIVTEKEII